MLSWQQFWAFLDNCAIYLTLKFMRCAAISFFGIGLVMLLRNKVFSRTIFVRGMLWSLFAILPFVGRLKAFYENAAVCKATWWMTSGVMNHAWIGRIYMGGIAIAAVFIFGKRMRLRRVVAKLDKAVVGGREVRVMAMAVTPFTTGILKPKIVLPAVMAESYRMDELDSIMQHEQTHIRLGHLWCYLAWDVLRCLFWVNPFLSVCQKYFQEDMEGICDRVCIQNSRNNAYAYGAVLLKSLKLLRSEQEQISSVVTYVGEKDFHDIKRRVENIANFRPYHKRRCAGMAAVAAVMLSLALVGIHRNSYAHCNELENILVYEYDGGGTLLPDQEGSLPRMVCYDEHYVYVDREAFEGFLDKSNAQGEIYIVFGGFQKFPGLGGDGYSCCYQADAQDKIAKIPYERPEESWMVKLFKIL